MFSRLALLASVAGLLAAQTPVITYRGVLNAASLAPPGLPNGGIARGGIFTIFGSDIGPATPATVNEFPLAPVFQGVSITVSQGGTSVSAIPIFVSANQINAILPSGVPLGTVSMRVGFNGRLSAPAAVEVVENAPGIFAISSGGYGPAVVQNFNSATDQPVNSLDTSAARGQVITIWATGLGKVPFADNVAPTAQNLDVAVTVTIGEHDALRSYAGRSPCCAGVDQIVVRIPDDAPLGCYVPLRVKAGNGVSNTATMAIASTAGAKCSDSFNPFSSLIRNTRKQGFILLDRIQNYVDSYITTVEQNTTDSVRAYFVNRDASPFAFDPQFSYPPPGSCTVQQTTGNLLRGAPLRGTPANALDAGASLQLTTKFNGNAEIGRITNPQTGYAAVVGSLRSSDGVGLLKLDFPDMTTLSFSGPLGSASIQPNTANLFAWAGRTPLDRLRRNVPQRITFTPNDFNAVAALSIVAYSAMHNASTALTCLAAPGADTFSLSPDLLANLPISYGRPDGSLAVIGIGVVPLARAVPFTSSGLDAGLALFSQWQTRTVYLQ
ncbi:hypothetical protein [Bryobacter aggregatus]|uniref:hypothetical protein n=1 Tax=Bryobacter aggregatus TaxID=360054 RepID=UPI0004E27FCB|nr:hypothetical protein [Bryobacter aggregatus]